MNFLRIKETCLYVPDLTAIITFYRDVLGLPLISYLEGRHAFFRAGESVLLCFNPADSGKKTSPPAHYGGGKQHFALEVKPQDYETSKREMLARGIVITATIVWENGQESFYFEDPAGNVLEIVPEGIWADG